jgi:hypothetical protein
MHQPEPRNIRLEMTGGRPFYLREVLAPVVEALGASPLFAPESWGLNEQSSFPFDAEEVSAVAEGKPAFYMLQLRRKKRLKHTAVIRLSNKPGLIVELPPATPAADWRHLFELGDTLADAYRPDIGWAHLFSKTGPPATDEDHATQLLMDACVVGSGADYDNAGPGNLGMRTYVGPRIVEMVGRDLLLSTPAEVTELAWGGVRLDLVAEPWAAERAALLAAWRGATEHLRPARVFSKVELDERGYARVGRGERIDPRAHRP